MAEEKNNAAAVMAKRPVATIHKICDNDVIAMPNNPLAQGHPGNELFQILVRKKMSATTSSAATMKDTLSMIYLSAKGKFLVLNEEDKHSGESTWIEADKDTAYSFVEHVVSTQLNEDTNNERIKAPCYDDSSYSIIDKQDDTDVSESITNNNDNDEDSAFEIENWDLLSLSSRQQEQKPVELDLSSVFISDIERDDRSTMNSSSYTMPESGTDSYGIKRRHDGNDDSSSSMSSFVLADGKQACRRCTFLNEPTVTVCTVCGQALGLSNPLFNLDAEIAARLGQEEKNEATRKTLDVIHEEEVGQLYLLDQQQRSDNINDNKNNPLERCRTLANKLTAAVQSFIPYYPTDGSVAVLPNQDLLYLCDSFLNIGDHFWYLNQQQARAFNVTCESQHSWDLEEHYGLVQTTESNDKIRRNGFGNTVTVFLPMKNNRELPQEYHVEMKTWVCLVLFGKKDVDYSFVSFQPRKLTLKDGKQCLPLACFDAPQYAKAFLSHLNFSAPKVLHVGETNAHPLRKRTVWDRELCSTKHLFGDSEKKAFDNTNSIDVILYGLSVLNKAIADVLGSEKECKTPLPKLETWLKVRHMFEARGKKTVKNPYVGVFGVDTNTDVMSCSGICENIAVTYDAYWASANKNKSYWVALVLLGEEGKDYHTQINNTGDVVETSFLISNWSQILPIARIPFSYFFSNHLVKCLIKETIFLDLTGRHSSGKFKVDVKNAIVRSRARLQRDKVKGKILTGNDGRIAGPQALKIE